MNANQFLHLSAQILFIALSIVALVDYVRHRNPRRRDFALLACSLGIPLGITLLKDVFGIRIGLLDLLGALVLFSQPYFLYRLLQYYRPSRRWLQWAVLLGMVLCWVILFLFIASYPAITQAVIFGYCVIVDAYCTWGYSRGIQGSVGILRRRFLLIVVSSGLFTPYFSIWPLSPHNGCVTHGSLWSYVLFSGQHLRPSTVLSAWLNVSSSCVRLPARPSMG